MHPRRSIIPVLLTYFIDNFGFAVVFLLIGPLVLNQNLAMPISAPNRPVLSLLALLIFPIAQSLGAPLFGSISDRIGRKKTFLISISGTIVGNGIMGIALQHQLLIWLLIGRLLAGFFAGNQTLCLAALADLSSNEKHKVYNFSLLAAVVGFSYICAAVAGNEISELSLSFPFWLAACLGAINITLLLILFKETHRAASPVGIWKIAGSFRRLFNNKRLNLLYLCFFFFMAAWVPSLQFLPQILTDQFHFTAKKIFNLLMALGILWSVSNWTLSRFSYLFTSYALWRLLLLLACFLIIAAALPVPSFFIAAFVIINIAAALSWTYLFVGISDQASMGMQGEVLGVSQAMNSLAVVMGLALKQIFMNYFPEHYYYFAAGMIFLAAISAGFSHIKR